MEEATSAFQTKPADIPIKIYKTVQTGPNIQLGGLKNGFWSVLYQLFIESAVAYPDNEPTNTQTSIAIGNLNFGDIDIIFLPE